MEINEEIHLEEYNPNWEKDYQLEYEKISDCLSGWECHIEHIGSTSVKGMYAKPIIDILIGVTAFPPSKQFVHVIENIGYEYMKTGSVPNRLYFVKRNIPNYNIQVVQFKSEVWNADIAFRDFIRSNRSVACEYSEVKRRIHLNGAKTLLEYSKKKAPVIEKLLAEISR